LTDLNVNNPIEGVSIALVGDALTQWNATIIGPSDTPYEGGKFIVYIDFSDNYPFKAPKVLFKTKIFHPNIKQDTGEICAQAIENAWVPTLNAKFVIESLMTLLKNPNADHPLEAEIAELFQKD
jgi:ubiquitin-conjugating enzyme E2 D